MGEEYTRVWLPGGKDYWGLFGKTGSPSCDDVICFIHPISVFVQRYRMISSFLVFEFFIAEFLLTYSWFAALCSFLLYRRETQLYTYICFFNILFHYGLSQDLIQYPVLYSRTLFIHSICNSLHLLIPNSQSFLPQLPLLLLPLTHTICVGLFLFHR